MLLCGSKTNKNEEKLKLANRKLNKFVGLVESYVWNKRELSLLICK